MVLGMNRTQYQTLYSFEGEENRRPCPPPTLTDTYLSRTSPASSHYLKKNNLGLFTDKMSSLHGLSGLTSQIASTMGPPSKPCAQVPPYYAEVRNRLWAIFIRLHLHFYPRSGTQSMLRLDDEDCAVLCLRQFDIRTLGDEWTATWHVASLTSRPQPTRRSA